MKQAEINEQSMKTLDSKGKCPTCHGTGTISWEAPYPEFYHNDIPVSFGAYCPTCNGGFAQRVEHIKRHAGLPESFRDATMANFDWSLYENADGTAADTAGKKRLVESFTNVFEKWQGEGKGLYICSNTRGSGKTFLAACICNELISKKGCRASFIREADLIDLSKQEPGLVPLCECDLLVIDDLGQKSAGQSWLSDLLYDVIDHRMQKKLVTIFTSNIGQRELNLDERIVNRIYSISVELHLPEYSVRTRRATEENRRFLKGLGLT